MTFTLTATQDIDSKNQELTNMQFIIKIQNMKVGNEYGNAIFIQELDFGTCIENRKEENGWFQMDLQNQRGYSKPCFF